jgi:xylulokinase
LNTILTYDLGGSSLRVGLFDFGGNCLTLKQKGLSIAPDSDGGYIADPQLWWTTFCDLVAATLKEIKDSTISIKALCGGGMTRCQVFLDENGTCVFPAILWPDNRARKESTLLENLSGNEKRWSPINEYHTLSRVLWVKRNHPNQYGQTNQIIEPKDFINFKLTGQIASDRISLSRILNVSNMELDKELMENAEICPDLFPKLKWPWQLMGICRPLLAPLDMLESVPVFTGSMDTWCSVTGTGAGCRDIYNVSGTSEATGIITREKTWIKGLVTLPWGKDLYQVGGPSQVGGDALKWFSDILITEPGHNVDTLATRMVDHRRKDDAPLFIPYLRGERAPIWEEKARGVFWNLHRTHTQKDLIHAVMEGVGMAGRYLLETIFEDNPIQGRVIISGGAAKNDLWCQIKADILGLTLVRTKEAETGLKGAFILAMAGLGEITSIKQGQKQFIETDRIFEPDPQMVSTYNILYPHWKKASLSMLALHRDLHS